EQVAFAVDAAQLAPGGGHEQAPVLVVLEVAQLAQQLGDAVEHLRDGARASAHLARETVGVALEPEPALRPARVRLAVVARVAGRSEERRVGEARDTR